MVKRLRNDKVLDHNLWRYLVNLWTFFLYLTIIADVAMRNGLSEFMGPVCSIYIALLAVYTAEKEFERWHDYHIGRHPGELYVYAWTILVVALLGLELTHYHNYKIPSEVFTAYIVAVGILAITKKSKTSYCSDKNEKKKK